MPYLSDGALAVLLEGQRRMECRMAAIEQHLAALRAGDAIGADAALVAAVYAVAGTRPFRARELLAMMRRPGAPEAALLLLVGPERSPGGLGRLLGATAGKPCHNGLVLSFEPSSDPKIWRVSTPSIPARP